MERDERQRDVDDAIHGNEMEGLHLTAATRADAEKYVDGTIDADELVRTTRARYGLE